ncbi:MAG: D-alanyl-D-alanine carboxypeptidase family protein, partial [Patescibacteria group bacterium]
MAINPLNPNDDDSLEKDSSNNSSNEPRSQAPKRAIPVSPKIETRRKQLDNIREAVQKKKPEKSIFDGVFGGPTEPEKKQKDESKKSIFGNVFGAEELDEPEETQNNSIFGNVFGSKESPKKEEEEEEDNSIFGNVWGSKPKKEETEEVNNPDTGGVFGTRPKPESNNETPKEKEKVNVEKINTQPSDLNPKTNEPAQETNQTPRQEQNADTPKEREKYTPNFQPDRTDDKSFTPPNQEKEVPIDKDNTRTAIPKPNKVDPQVKPEQIDTPPESSSRNPTPKKSRPTNDFAQDLRSIQQKSRPQDSSSSSSTRSKNLTPSSTSTTPPSSTVDRNRFINTTSSIKVSKSKKPQDTQPTKKKQFDPLRIRVTSRQRAKNIKSKGKNPLKLGLIALAASILAATPSEPVKSSGIFNSGNVFQEQLGGKNTPKSTQFDDPKALKPESSTSEFGVKQSEYDESGNLSDSSKNKNSEQTEPKTNSNNQPSTNQAAQNNQKQGQSDSSNSQQKKDLATSSTSSEIPTVPQQGSSDDLNAPLTAGDYDDGRLSLPLSEKTGFEQSSPSSALTSNNGDNQENTDQTDQKTPSLPNNTNSSSSNNQNQVQPTGGGKKKLDPAKMLWAAVKPWLTQSTLMFIAAMLVVLGLVGIGAYVVTQVLDKVCQKEEYIKFIADASNNPAAKAMVDACKVYASITGRGCGGTTTSNLTGVECIGKKLDESGTDTIQMQNAKESVPVKKSCLNEIIKAGKEAKVKEFTLRFAISVHPIESTTKCFQSANLTPCLGLAQFCVGGSYESAIKGIFTGSYDEFLNNPVAQMKAIEQFLDEKRTIEKSGSLPQCQKDHFKGKSEIYKLTYMWLISGCPGTVDGNKTPNTAYAESAEKNFVATDCSEFKSKIASSIDFLKGLSPSIEVNAQNDPGVASKDLQNKVIELINSGKVDLALSSKEAFIADITGSSYPNQWGNPINGPIHTNTANMIILLAEKFPGIRITSMGNQTHSPTNGWHNAKPIQAFDFDKITSASPQINGDSTEKLNQVMETIINSKIGRALRMNPSNIARMDKKYSSAITIQPDDGYTWIHLTVEAKATLNSSGTSSSNSITCTNLQQDSEQASDNSNTSTRLNKNSLSDQEWKTIKAKYGTIQSPDQFVTMGDDATFGAAPTLTLFNNKAASDRIYNLAKEAGYKQRNLASSGDLVGKGENRYKMRSRAMKALDDFANAARKDGNKIELVSGFRSPEEQKDIFESKLDDLCVAKLGVKCNVDEIANGKLDDLIKERLRKSSVPGYSKHHTVLAADINESKDVELETITSTKLYKYMKEDNYLNLKRFGFIPS